LQLKKLLAHCLSSQLELRGELCNGCRALPFQRQKDGTAAVWKLIYGEDGDSPGKDMNRL
jgi:hypothetical protein